ncbi:MAG: hypothetical protein JWN76_1305 [Chitinophagaceae bacterium]|nr:hypothetical protein [Chitinophagaceae bacterium]
MRISRSLQGEFENEMSNTRKILERVPQNPDWKPHEKSMSLGRLSTHIAEIPTWITMTLATEELDWSKFDYKPFAAESNEALLKFFDKNVEDARTTILTAADEAFLADWTMRNGDQVYFTMPKVAVVRTFAMNHLIHHRAQLTVYLRLLNVPLPQLYGPTADEQ